MTVKTPSLLILKNNEHHLYDIFIELLKKEFKIRYKSQVLGYLWSLANPLSSAFVYYIVFGVLMKSREPNYPIFLIAALFPWQWIANSVSASPRIFISNAKLVKKVSFPRNMITFVLVFQDMVHFIISIPIIVAFMLFYKILPSVTWIWGIPLLCLIQFMLVYSFALLIGTINLFLRDTQRLVDIFIMYLFYFTPILYSVKKIPIRFHDFLYLHPFAPIIICWRELLLSGKIPLNYLLSSSIYAVSIFLISNTIYKKLSWRFAEVL